MEHREVGRTGVQLSVVGLGTAQLQMLPESQAIATLRRGIESGANWIHTAPDYGAVEPWIAKAVRESGRRVSVVTQSPATLDLLGPFFDNACHFFTSPGERGLDLYGINCIDDIESSGENVWGPGGMIDFLHAQKAAGRLRGVFCSTHGEPDYVAKLIESGAFDAVMLAWNPVGFHLLSYFAQRDGRHFEDLAEFQRRIFPLAASRGVSVLLMKALGGGLFARGKAFQPVHWFGAPTRVPVATLLRAALAEPAVAAVAAGVASPEEAEEDALAGHGDIAPAAADRERIDRFVHESRLSLCSRCGDCESTCSRDLKISSMFRDAYLWHYRNETFMYHEPDHYFALASETSACVTCDNRTCECPAGLDLPTVLPALHERMITLRASGQHPPVPGAGAGATVHGRHHVLMLHAEVPASAASGAPVTARFLVQNEGADMWTGFTHIADPAVASGIAVVIDGSPSQIIPLRHNICAGQRSHIAIEFRAPSAIGAYTVDYRLMTLNDDPLSARATVFRRHMLEVRPS